MNLLVFKNWKHKINNDADVLFMCSFFLTNINPDSIPCFGYRGVGMELDK